MSGLLVLPSDSLVIKFLPAFLLVGLLVHLVSTYLKLRSIPGPFVAKFTDAWRLRLVCGRLAHEGYKKLHEKHGDLVRIGPNAISICKPEIVSEIYGVKATYAKSDFYAVWHNMVNGKRVASMVFIQDEAHHGKVKRPIASSYALSQMIEYEPLINSTVAVFLARLDDVFASTGDVCNFGHWLQYFAFDVIGELTFSRRLGFLETGTDVEGIIGSMSANFDRCSVLGQMPWLDLITYKNPIYLKFFAPAIPSAIVSFGHRRLKERTEGKEKRSDSAVGLEIKDAALSESIGCTADKPDFLTRFLQVHEEQPDVVPMEQLLTYLFMNINAGSDTVTSSLRSIFYYLLKNPESLEKLRSELDEKHSTSELSMPLPQWKEVQDLPYLNAVIKEGLRLGPALTLQMERIVPSEGLRIDDTFIPPGTIVGVCPWVLHRDKRIFGDDADKWRPERWLEDDERTKYMDSHILSFGAGKRTCMGRHIAMMEMCKVIPALIYRYNIRLQHPDKEWKVHNAWAVRQTGLDVYMERREQQE